MSPVNRYQEWMVRAACYALLLSLLPVALLALGIVQLPSDVSVDDISGLSDSNHSSAQITDDTKVDWTIFRGDSSGVAAPVNTLSRRFRLAGTFFSFGSGENDRRKAILDDKEASSQLIVSESQSVDDRIMVVRIFSDRIILRGPQGEEQLWLSFVRGDRPAGAGGSSGIAGTLEPGDAALDRFGGQRIGENRWVFSRERLLGYYEELKEDPERLLKVFDSLKPADIEGQVIDNYVRGESPDINGYKLQAEGEEEFFRAMGLQENDVVRSVNSMKMTNRRRAEYFIKEFAANRANAFVLEVERDGQPQKLVYQVR